MAQYLNSHTGQTVNRDPGQPMPYGPGVWQGVGTVCNPLQGGQSAPVSYAQPQQPTVSHPFTTPPSTSSNTNTSGPTRYFPQAPKAPSIPFFNKRQKRLLLLGFVLGSLWAYLPFFFEGMGFYSSFPFRVSGHSGILFSGLLLIFSFLRHPSKESVFKAFVVTAVLLFVFRYLLSPIPSFYYAGFLHF